jgi:hypothetical protein
VVDYLGVVSIVGEEGSCKSSMALTFPKPIYHFEIDIGGFSRAIWRIEKQFKVKRLNQDDDIQGVNFADFDIISKPYPKPLDISKLMGQLSEGKKTDKNFTVRFPKQVTGIKEIWQRIVTDFVIVCQQPAVSSIIMDTASLLYTYSHQGYLQECQERQILNWRSNSMTKNTPFDENNFRERLQPMEYATPFDRMEQIMQTAKSFRKNLILVHFPTDEYTKMVNEKGETVDGKSGVKIADGYKGIPKAADLIVWTYIKDSISMGRTTKQPLCKITKAGIDGFGLDAVGQEITATYEGIEALRNILAMQRGG